ncbi:MAG: VOC family protein [Actinobacteria bacterium]|nr:VOC family protein [Actinomycetota bacterium]
MTMNLRPDHAGISVGDLEASITWYRDMLGQTAVRVPSFATTPATWWTS